MNLTNKKNDVRNKKIIRRKGFKDLTSISYTKSLTRYVEEEVPSINSTCLLIRLLVRYRDPALPLLKIRKHKYSCSCS